MPIIKNATRGNGAVNQDDALNDAGLNLLDGATPLATPIAPELEHQRLIAADVSEPLEDRVEAFEDIFESEVGDTSMSRARNIEREVGLRQIFLKFEGGNPTGTQKDRISFAQAMAQKSSGFRVITNTRCRSRGNAPSTTKSMMPILAVEYYHSAPSLWRNCL